METSKFITVTMHINTASFRSVNGEWHFKFERDLTQFIEVPIFKFATESLNVAVTKVADLVARHPEKYFNEINIK